MVDLRDRSVIFYVLENWTRASVPEVLLMLVLLLLWKINGHVAYPFIFHNIYYAI